MFGNIFFHETLRKNVAIFGTIFNDISIVRRDSSQQEIQRIKVPLAYGPRMKFLVRVNDNLDAQKKVAITLPRMSFEITSLTYDPERKLNKIRKTTKVKDQSTEKRVFNPVPYNIGMELNIMTKYMNDSNQIIEQILPWFNPSYTISAKSLPELGLLDDIAIVLENVTFTDNYEDDWLNRREIIYTLSFIMKTYFYGPIKEQPVITKVQVDTLVPKGDVDNKEVRDKTAREERVIITPDPPNATSEDDFGFTEVFQSFTDGKKYNPVTGNDEDIT